MSIDDTQDSHQSGNGVYTEPPAPKRTWVRILVYAVLLGAVGFGVWRIYQNQQAAKQQFGDIEERLLFVGILRLGVTLEPYSSGISLLVQHFVSR